MKLSMLLVLPLIVIGCASTGDLKATQGDVKTLRERLDAVVISETCHGETLELVMLVNLMRDPTLQADHDAFVEAQLTFTALQQQQQNDCMRLSALRKSQQNGSK